MPERGGDRLGVDGRFLVRGERRVFLKAVTYGPFLQGEELEVREEFERIAEVGFNAVRVYEEPDEALLEAAGANRLVVLAGLPWEWSRDFIREPRLWTEGRLRLTAFLKRHGRHPALGALLVANEIPSDLVRWMGPVAVRESLEELIAECQARCPDLLVGYSNYPSTEYLEPRGADFTAFNIYLEEREAFASYLRRLQNIAGDRPVLVTEFGLDTVRHAEEEQAGMLEWHFEECLAAGIAGTTVFSWSDRWQTGGRRVRDWAFGLTRADRTGKEALDRLRNVLPAIRTHRDVRHGGPWPRISVVVCTRNGAGTLEPCLQACQQLAYPDFEVLVVDDGSTDATPAIVARFPAVRYERQDPAGLSVARNRGARIAAGEIIAYTDDDCEPDCDWLFWLALAYRNPRVGAAGGPNLPPPAGGLQEAVVAAAPGAPAHVLIDDSRAEHLPGCNLSIRREAFEEIGGFEARYVAAGDDVDVCWRLADAGWTLAYAAPAFVWHRRRVSLWRYFRQQAGYGRAEALLYGAHPDRFDGHAIRWTGLIYSGVPVAVDEHSRIYFGPLGEAPYQGVQLSGLPPRGLEPGFDGPGGRALLWLARALQPWVRGLRRWACGGPPPKVRTRTRRKVYRDDLRNTVEFAFAGEAGWNREEFLGLLRAEGWWPCEPTERWDLERGSLRLQTVTEHAGGGVVIVRVRLQHPPGSQTQSLMLVESAALASGLKRP